MPCAMPKRVTDHFRGRSWRPGGGSAGRAGEVRYFDLRTLGSSRGVGARRRGDYGHDEQCKHQEWRERGEPHENSDRRS